MSGADLPSSDDAPLTAPVGSGEPPAGAARRRPRLTIARLGPRSLTARLISGVVSLIVVLVLIVGTGTYVALRSFLFSKLDDQVTNAAEQNARYFRGCLLNGQCMNESLLSATEWIAVLHSDGSNVALGPSTAQLIVLQLDARDRAAIVADPGRMRTVEVGGTEIRLSAHPSVEDLLVVTGLSSADVRTTLARLVLLEAIIGGVAVLLAFGATSYGVRLSLRGLQRVTSTAQEVATELGPTGSGLERRVPNQDDGTEVGQLAGSMNTLLSAVQTQFAARLAGEARLRQFLADASHELRTPLTSIRGYAELARMQRAATAGTDNGGPDDNLARIEAEGTRMSRLVEDLLTLARSDRAEQIRPSTELVGLDELVDDVVRDVHVAHPARTLSADCAPDLHVIGDHDQLLRMLRNLVSNAAVHTAPQHPIRITARSAGAEAVLEVVDGGPGLPPEQAAHVFERFWRADKARTRARGGTGLGLSIVDSIVRAHGGTISFTSTVEQGSTVTVRLPRVEPG